MRISKTGSYRLIYQEKESVRLSENMWGTHELTKEAMERSLRALKVLFIWLTLWR